MTRSGKRAPTSSQVTRSQPEQSNPPQPNGDPTQLELLQAFVRRGQRAQAAVDETLDRMQQELEADAVRSRRRRGRT